MNVTQAETRLAVKFPALIASTRHGVPPPARTSVYICLLWLQSARAP